MTPAPCYNPAMRYLVTGTARGIGLELVKQLADRGEHVIATLRDPGRARAIEALGAHVRTVICDVAEPAGRSALRSALADATLDVVINNAGVMGGMTSVEDLDLADAARTYEVNALGPLAVVQAALPALLRGTTRHIAAISSGMGSIGDNTSGGAYAYRMSKAALNMGFRSLSIDLAGRGFVCVVLNPGWVQTDMGGGGAPTPVSESVAKMLERLDGLTASDNGRFLDYQGGELAW